MFYHDALSLMTAKDTVAWMKDQKSTDRAGQPMSYYDRWITPQHGLNDNIDGKRNFANRPPGNSPELMPLDNSLNRDVHCCVDRHICYSAHLPDDDARKFCSSTPPKLRSAYLRLWGPANGADGGAVSSKRIVQDVEKFLVALMEIYKEKGSVVVGCCERNGRRDEATRADNCLESRAGGHRVEGAGSGDSEQWVHVDLADCMDQCSAASERVHKG
jgi:hypothetical protein